MTSHRNRSSTPIPYVRRCFGLGLCIQCHEQPSRLEIEQFDRRGETSSGPAVHNRRQKFPTSRAKARLGGTLVGLQLADEDFDGIRGCTGPCGRAAVAKSADFGRWRAGGLKLFLQPYPPPLLFGVCARFEIRVRFNLIWQMLGGEYD